MCVQANPVAAFDRWLSVHKKDYKDDVAVSVGCRTPLYHSRSHLSAC
jgi:hypothetical protein